MASGASVMRLESRPGIRLLVEADRSAFDLLVDFVHERLVDVRDGDGILGAVGEIADGVEPGRVERLDLPGFELLVKGAVIEPGLAFARLNEPFDDDEDGDHRQDDQDDRLEMLAHALG